MIFFLVICCIIWVYLLSVFYRGHMNFWFFILGSVGTFVFLMLWIEPILITPLTDAISVVSGFLGNLTGFYKAYFQYGVLFINSKNYNISLYIDYECSGIIEIIAFSSMLWFFNVYHIYEKVIINIIGLFWIFTANIIRIFIICTLIYFFGNNIFYFAHTIFGRIVFYALSITLYFHVFTRPQILRQKLGSFKYENN